MEIDKLKKRILEIKYLQKENHIGSCISAVSIIEDIYKGIYGPLGKDDRFILSAGHAGVALYVLLEKMGILPKKQTLSLESHPKMNKNYGIWASTGSLGHGIGIAVGMALTKQSEVYCLVSDGECAEGSVWEALRIAEENKLTNFHVFVNANGWGGLDRINLDRLKKKLSGYEVDIHFIETNSDILPYYRGIDAHYKSLTQKQYEKIVC